MTKDHNLGPVVSGLRAVLAHTFTLYFKTHSAHWNVTGLEFNSLHMLFETQYQELWAATDEIAERLRALNTTAPEGWNAIARESTFSDWTGQETASAFIQGLANDHVKIIALIQQQIAIASEHGDDGSEDLLIGRLKAHQKALWMLNATAAR